MNNLKILVVDDESRMRKLVKDFLVRSGYEVLEAADGEEAIDIFFTQKNIDLVILDVMMPMLDGYQVLSTIRKFETDRNFKPEERTRVVMTTALNEEINVKKAMEIGCDAYVGKPINVERFEMLLSKMGFEPIK